MSTGHHVAERTARYPRSARVRVRAEFDTVFARGHRAATPMLALHYLPDDRPARLGFAVSRKVDTRAVIRNRIKRVLRDYFRRHRATLAGGAYVLRQALRRAALPPSLANGTMPPACPPSEQAPVPSGATSPSAS
jgi:ribonuclease P protein component